jgi:hypothetical protein
MGHCITGCLIYLGDEQAVEEGRLAPAYDSRSQAALQNLGGPPASRFQARDTASMTHWVGRQNCRLRFTAFLDRH